MDSGYFKEDDTYIRLRTLVLQQFGDAAPVAPLTCFTTDLAADSLDMIEMVMRVEEEFGIRVPDGVGAFTTIGDAVVLIRSLQAK